MASPWPPPADDPEALVETHAAVLDWLAALFPSPRDAVRDTVQESVSGEPRDGDRWILTCALASVEPVPSRSHNAAADRASTPPQSQRPRTAPSSDAMASVQQRTAGVALARVRPARGPVSNGLEQPPEEAMATPTGGAAGQAAQPPSSSSCGGPPSTVSSPLPFARAPKASGHAHPEAKQRHPNPPGTGYTFRAMRGCTITCTHRPSAFLPLLCMGCSW
jgi:hypothetical protein